jgi:hypothetical protein
MGVQLPLPAPPNMIYTSLIYNYLRVHVTH